MDLADHCRKQHEYCVLIHERLGQSLPSEVVVHLVEDAFPVYSLIIEQDYFIFGLFLFVGENAPVCGRSKRWLFNRTRHSPRIRFHRSKCRTRPG